MTHDTQARNAETPCPNVSWLSKTTRLLGDPDRLRQLFLNLADNALKYTPVGGTVTFSLWREDGWVRVAVSDTGISIAPEDRPHIFERFYRADKSRSRAAGGTGLGLAIARWIAQAHGGRIEVESALGTGSTFTIWLPLAGNRASQRRIAEKEQE